MNGHARVQAGRSHLARAERAACASDMKVKSNSWQHGALVLARGTVDAARVVGVRGDDEWVRASRDSLLSVAAAENTVATSARP